MEKYLTFEDESSKKFWRVQTDDTQVTVTYGRIGAAGQTQTKEYASSAEAEKEAEKQAASKIKKGYKEAASPAGAPAPKAPAETKAAAPAKATSAKKAPKTETGPAPVADDGQPKPWHDAGHWDFPWYCGDETVFANLDKPLDTEEDNKSRAAAQKPALSIPEGVVFEDNDDDSERMEKILLFLPTGEAVAYLRASLGEQEKNPGPDKVEEQMRHYVVHHLERYCQWIRYHEDCAKWLDMLRALIPDDGAFKTRISACLAEGMKEALGDGIVNGDNIAHIQWLLENGAPIEWKFDIRCKYIRHFVDEYKKNPDPARVPGVFAAYREDFCRKHAPGYAKGLLRFLTHLATGEDVDSDSPGKIKTPEDTGDLTHFELDLSEIMARPHRRAGYKFGFEYDGISAGDGAVDLQRHLSPILQKMAADGVFEKIKSGLIARGLLVLHISCNRGKSEPFLHLALDKTKAQAEAKALEALIAGLEDRAENGEFDAVTEESLQTAASALMDEIHLPRDIPRFRRLMEKYTYNLQNANLAECAHQLTGSYDHLDFALKNDWSACSLLNYKNRWSRESLENALSDWVDFPAMKARMLAHAEEQKARDERNGAGEKKVKRNSRNAASFTRNFTEADIFLNTNNIIARACKNGTIHIRFKIEGEAGYAEALDWLNALLEKKYADLNGGYSIHARFLIAPVFIKPLENLMDENEEYGFPKSSCHAFFARAVQYPALREKVKQYAENALHKYNWYTDLDGEENTVTGTFAALALAFCEEQYVPLAGLYGRESDDEHQYIQLMVTKPLFKRWGATPAVACALFDIAASNGQDGAIYLPQAVLQSVACLRAILAHCETGPMAGNNFLKYCVPRFVEGVWSEDTKKNLKRLAIMRNEAEAAEDKNTIAEFYNFYKKYAAEQHGEDYGKDMRFEGESPVDIVIPEYHENPPLLLTRQEARAAGWEWNDSWYDDRRGILVHPAAVDSLELYDYIAAQWELGCKNARNLDMSRNWGEGCFRVGEYVFNTRGMKYSCAVVLTDGKNKPFVLYGLLNAVPLIARWCKRPFKTAQEAYAARADALIKEAPEKPVFSEADWALEKRLDVAMSALFNEQYWIAGQIAKEFTPEQGRFYDAALVVRIQIAKKARDDVLARELTEDLSRSASNGIVTTA
jgi:predicted DNA-binding WGR domain protein